MTQPIKWSAVIGSVAGMISVTGMGNTGDYVAASIPGISALIGSCAAAQLYVVAAIVDTTGTAIFLFFFAVGGSVTFMAATI